MVDSTNRVREGRMHIPRSRGAVSGLLIMALGVWGALVPFVGPLFDFAFTPDRAWTWTAGRGWLEVLPGAVAVLGGLLLLTSRNRATAMLGGWLAVAAGAWFVVGRAVAGPLGLGGAGQPVAANETKQVWLELTYFSGLGALIVFLAALAVGRLSVRSARDIAYRETRVPTAEPHPVTDTTRDGTDTTGWSRPDRTDAAATEPVDRKRHGLFGRRRTKVRDKLAVR